jgi:hypothetical protein
MSGNVLLVIPIQKPLAALVCFGRLFVQVVQWVQAMEY